MPIFASAAYNRAYMQECGKALYLHYPPLWVTLGIIGACPYRCLFCAYHSLDARFGNSNVYNIKYIMPYTIFTRLVDFFHAGGVPRIHVCASGEPLLHPDFLKMLDYIILKYGSVSFQSNFDKNIIEKKRIIHEIIVRQKNISMITTDIIGNDDIKKGGNERNLYNVLKILSETSIPVIRGQFLITKSNYQDLESIIYALYQHNIRLNLIASVVFPHAFNAFTSIENKFKLDDMGMADFLGKMQMLAQRLRIRLFIQNSLPSCPAFWQKFQIWPTSASDPTRLYENIIPHACNAVVKGNMYSLGYVFDYNNIFELWNNDAFIHIRKSIIEGIYPDTKCRACPYAENLN